MNSAWRSWLTSFFVFGLVATSAQGGRININLTEFVPTGTGTDGTGALGGGIWNRINPAQAALANALVDSAGRATSITATDTGTGNPGGASQMGNAIQDESWGRNSIVTVTLFGLIPNQVYKVVVYGDRIGSGAPGSDTFNVNGIDKVLTNPGDANIPLPGVENTDYGVFIISATAGGLVTIIAPYVAGIQIEGVLSKTETGPQPDCRISKSGATSGGKGNDLYKSRKDRRQSISQTTNRRSKRYFINIENDGEEIDRFYGKASWNKRRATVKIIGREGDGNITNAMRKGDYRYTLCKGEIQRFKVIIKPSRRKSGQLGVLISATSSTRSKKKVDSSNCLLTVKK